MQVHKVREHQLPPEVHSKFAEIEFEDEKYRLATEKYTRQLNILQPLNYILCAGNITLGCISIIKGQFGQASINLILAAWMIIIIIKAEKWKRKKKQEGAINHCSNAVERKRRLYG